MNAKTTATQSQQTKVTATTLEAKGAILTILTTHNDIFARAIREAVADLADIHPHQDGTEACKKAHELLRQAQELTNEAMATVTRVLR